MTKRLHAGAVDDLLEAMFDAVYVVDRDRRITYWNRAAERLTGYSAAEVVGHSCSENILVHVNGAGESLCLGTCPAAFTMSDGSMRESELFLHHRSGHRVPVRVRVIPLRDETGASVGAAEIFRESTPGAALRAEAERLRRLALLDPVTEVGNRRFLDAVVEQAFASDGVATRGLGLLFVDVDRFKDVNDAHGHETGDAVLRMVAQTIAGALRAHDVVGRWGGDEFLILARDVDIRGLATVAEKVRAVVASAFLPKGDAKVSVTVSIGGAIRRAAEPAASVLQRADGLLYRSKSAGRDAVTLDESGVPERKLSAVR